MELTDTTNIFVEVSIILFKYLFALLSSYFVVVIVLRGDDRRCECADNAVVPMLKYLPSTLLRPVRI